MKRLLTAASIREAHAAGQRSIALYPGPCIVTPEARSVAEDLGIALVEQAAVDNTASAAIPPPAPSATPAASLAAPLAIIRDAVLARLPAGAASPEAVEQLVQKIAAEQAAKPGAPCPEPAAPCESARIGRGIKRIKGGTVRMGRFDGAGHGNQVGIADVLNDADGSPMAAGFMAWEKCFFPWTLNYDEIDVVLEGSLHIRHGGQTVVAEAGDVIFIPKGSSIEFGTPDKVRFLYVTYPANWEAQ